MRMVRVGLRENGYRSLLLIHYSLCVEVGRGGNCVLTAITIAIVLAHLHENEIDRVLEQCYRYADYSVTSTACGRECPHACSWVCQCSGELVSCELSKVTL